MASSLFTPFKKLLLDGDIDLLTDTIKAVLVDSADYTFSAAHDFLDDVAVGARVATSAALASKTTTGGVFDSADFSFTAVTGDPSEVIILYKDTGVAATSPLIGYWDGMAVTPNGGSIDVAVNAAGWFAL